MRGQTFKKKIMRYVKDQYVKLFYRGFYKINDY